MRDQPGSVGHSRRGEGRCSVSGGDEVLRDEVKRQIAMTGGTLVIGMDTDDAGTAARCGVAAMAVELGIKPTQFRSVTWPEHDVNDWLQKSGDEGAAVKLLESSPSWLEVLLQEAVSASVDEQDEAAVQTLFRALAVLDIYDLARWRGRVCDSLGINKSDFDGILKATRREIGMNEDGRPKYEILAGRICHRYYDRGGSEVVDPLANFSALISADVVVDDGEDQSRHFEIEGSICSGEPFPAAEVTAEEFPKMNWILPAWGARATMAAGSTVRDHLRAAIQSLSKEIERRYEYAHLGWRMINGAPVYMTTTGAVGGGDERVRLPDEFEHYHLPLSTTDGVREAVKASVSFWDVGEWDITVPLWAAMYHAPLCSILPPAFTVWLYGTTGSFKSTVSALALCHFGAFTYDTPPGSWTSTAFALRRLMFLSKDSPFWVDDYAPQATAQAQLDIIKRADSLLREWGNRMGRSAGQADGTLRAAQKPRGLGICTAEMLPPGPSIMPRLYAIELYPGAIREAELTPRQERDALRYPEAMTGYLLWLTRRWDDLVSWTGKRMRERRSEARVRMRQHRRSAPNVATLGVGLELGLQYAYELGAIDATEFDGRLAAGWELLVTTGEKQDAGVNQEADPIRLFFDALEQMLTQGSVYLRHRYYCDDRERDWPTPDHRALNAEFIGWWGSDGDESKLAPQCEYDDARFWYLIPNVALNVVVQFYRQAHQVFPDDRRGLQAKLLERGLLFPIGSQTYLYQMPIEGRPRVWRISKPVAGKAP